MPASNIHTMDWRVSKRLEVSFDTDTSTQSDDSAPITKRIVDITCTPCQHATGRTRRASYKSLWASWVVEEVITDYLAESARPPVKVITDYLAESARPPVKVYFAGDTGYRTVFDGEDEEEVPYCPAFEEIGEIFGGFDFAMVPIG